MSHFTVLVIGNEPEELLEPFSEHIEVPKTSEVSEDEKQSFIETYTIVKPDRSYGIKDEAEAEKNKLLSFDELYDQYGEDWNDSAWKKDTNGIWCEFSTYNPNSKWDWYLLGGRWSGFFKVKPIAALPFQMEGFSTAEVNNLVELYKTNGQKFLNVTSKYNGKTESIRKTIADIVDSMENVKFPEYTVGEAGLMTEEPKIGYADQLLKKDIDFVGMRADAILNAEKDYDEFHAILKGREFPLWPAILEKYPEDQIDAAREEFNNLETVKDLNKAGYYFNNERFNVSREEFLRKAELSAFSTFAFLNEKGWCERGNMGWWGIVTNEKDDEQWIIEFNKMLDELPDDTLLSLYDCHI
jgi:hypothetical protein